MPFHAGDDIEGEAEIQRRIKLTEMSGWSRKKKLKTLSAYSKCRPESGCLCNGFKDEHSQSEKSFDNMHEICQGCGHELSAHISQFESAPDEELNFFLGVVIDIGTLHSFLSAEEDSDTKHIYYEFSRKLAKCIQEKKRPCNLETAENLPFELPSIVDAVFNFTEIKYGHLPADDLEDMMNISKLFLSCMNSLELHPLKQILNKHPAYERFLVNYKRWLHFCFIPKSCRSLQYHGTPDIFGFTLMQFIFEGNQRRLVRHFETYAPDERFLVPAEKKPALIQKCKDFVAALREEVYNHNSEMWDMEYTKKSLAAFSAKQRELAAAAEQSGGGNSGTSEGDAKQGSSAQNGNGETKSNDVKESIGGKEENNV